jgi:hypothetical protein
MRQSVLKQRTVLSLYRRWSCKSLTLALLVLLFVACTQSEDFRIQTTPVEETPKPSTPIVTNAPQPNSTPTQTITYEPTVASTLEATRTPEVTSAFEPTLTPTWWVTPKITATPIASSPATAEELTTLLKQLYSITTPCYGSLLNIQSPQVEPVGTPEFIEVTIQLEKWWIEEIADNYTNNLRAFVACDPAFCQHKLLVKNLSSEEIYEINWNARMSWRPIDNLIWLGDNILAFEQSTGPYFWHIVALDVQARNFVHYSIASSQCPLTPTSTPVD